MKKICIFTLVAVLALGLMTGCRGNKPMDTTVPTTVAPTTAPTTMPTTQPTTAPTTAPTTEPPMDDLLPGTEDTIDPSNGANEDQTRNRRMPKY